MSSSGCYLRCFLTPRSNILRLQGAMSACEGHHTARYLSRMDNADFDWPDAQADNVSQLKEKFQRLLSVIVEQSIGDD